MPVVTHNVSEFCLQVYYNYTLNNYHVWIDSLQALFSMLDLIVCDEAFGRSGFNVSGMGNVTISAVNCLGQTATYKVSLTRLYHD